ncbi:DNA mismatch repair protein Msh1 [Microthyrium microscopicum]|uniref:DNA mismatch repair protein Msh1 n=1 Tax=Microthyrium microscopicum TaxID=703497 RepID=A0A6A6UTB8_9PEZI|nr:DNA mismatch repair protein Msh1 [Microthyrium microscopicum]
MRIRGYDARRLTQISRRFSSRPPVRPRIHTSWETSATHSVSSSIVWSRGAKRVTEATLLDISQGPLPKKAGEDDISKDEAPVYPTVVQQALNNMRKFSQCVVLTRVGNFYELYFDQADEFGPILNLKASIKKTNAGPVSMTGFPYFQLDRYLKILVQDQNRYVAISEEFANSASAKVKSGGLLFDRKVTRVITPGTLIDEKFMDPWENNFLLSIHSSDFGNGVTTTGNSDSPVPITLGLAWLDLSSGDFFTQSTDIGALSSALARIGPREVVLDRGFADQRSAELKAVLAEGRYVVTYHNGSQLGSVETWGCMLEDSGATTEASKFSKTEVEAGNLLLQYVNTRLMGEAPKLRPPIQRHNEEYMAIDKNSVKALEIRETLRDGLLEGSLLHAVRRTVTKSGHRLLWQRLISPSTSLQEINHRLDLVSELLHNPNLRSNLVSLLRMTSDSWRLLQKFSFGRGDPDDLLGLARTIQVTTQITELLQRHILDPEYVDSSPLVQASMQESVKKLLDRLETNDTNALAQLIFEAIDEEKVTEKQRMEDDEAANVIQMAETVLISAGEQVKAKSKAKKAAVEKDRDSILPSEVWIMHPSASPTLQKLHTQLEELWLEMENLSKDLRETSGAQSLTLKWTPGLGHIIHLKGKDASASLSALGLDNVRAVKSSQSTRSIHHPRWTQLGNRIDDVKLRIRGEENKVFTSLREKVILNIVRLRRNAAVLDELDVAASWATLAEEQHLVRPLLNYGTAHHIIAGRHPTVEPGLTAQGRTFTHNDLLVGEDITVDTDHTATTNPRILLITGPNMGGKSTYLRQNALISILAQTGSYVPAAYASIGIVDAIYSRVGSADNLFQDQSTFMVEMLETAHILRAATPRSFVVMDEVGRGTTPEDGIAVGYAALHHLYNVNKCRALFATHFHALADMTAGWDGVKCWCTDVTEHQDDGKEGFSYVHRLREGVNRESHALKVARLAGMPESVVEVAREVLVGLKMDVGNESISKAKTASSADG